VRGRGVTLGSVGRGKFDRGRFPKSKTSIKGELEILQVKRSKNFITQRLAKCLKVV
jgi:hypothetical protein